ncbi:MAG TPA: hypothetical protein C5S37_13380 [Methanophagales archaeon]|nr:hypothetical protein [Methanophagales archaeon]
MKKELFFVFVIIAIALLFVFIVFIHGPEVKPGIVIHGADADGKSHKILQTEQGFDELSKECKDILSSIDGQYKLAMSYNELNAMKRGNKYIGIVFPDPVNITTKKKTDGEYRVIRMKEATFMLSGEYYGHIFTQEKHARWVGVWSSERDLNKLNVMAESLIG